MPLTVERVQDEVERTLMERGHYEVAKAYILYREKRSALRRVRHTIARTVGDNSLDEVLRRIQMDFTEEIYSLAALQMKFESFCRPGEDFLCPERDELFTYSGLDLLLKRYVIQSRSRVPLETPQEMFLGIALHLAMNEGSDRNAQRLSAGCCTDLQHIYPLRYLGGHRSNYEEILFRGEKGQHAAPRCSGAFYGYMVVL